MPSLFDQLLVAVLVLNFYCLGTSRIGAVIRTVAIQGVLIGALPILAHGAFTWQRLLLTVPALALKGAILPVMLLRAMRAAEIRREVEPLVGIIPTLVLGALGTALAVAFSQRLPLLPDHAETLLVPASLATVFTGFLMLTTRLKAISQVLGYLTLENGIFVFGLLLVDAVPALVEFGVLLDLFVCIFVMGIILNHINREFSGLGTERLSALRE